MAAPAKKAAARYGLSHPETAFVRQAYRRPSAVSGTLRRPKQQPVYTAPAVCAGNILGQSKGKEIPVTTTYRSVATRRTHHRAPFAALGITVLGLLGFLAVYMTAATGGADSGTSYPNIRLNIAGVTCAQAHNTDNDFTRAVIQATQAEPDYRGVQAFGFTPPVNPRDVAPFQELLRTRQDQLDKLVYSVNAGTCTDKPTATVTDGHGHTKTMAVVYGNQPNLPISGSQSNLDPRTVPVTAGTNGDKVRTNTWADLLDLFGDQKWYINCANTNLDMDWYHDAPKYTTTEAAHDNRFILAVNTSAKLTDDQIRQRAAADGNPNTGKLSVVRTPSIINTRHLAQDRCDTFVDSRSMIRVSLGKVVFDSQGQFKSLEQDKGVFVDCHNLWQLPKSAPVPTTPPTPGTSTPPGATPPGTTPPHTVPPTTRPPSTCKPPTHDNGHGKCIESKDSNQGAGHQGNVPTQVQGTNPPSTKPKPRPSDPPKTYTPPPPPAAAPVVTHTTKRVTPPPQTVQPTDPATGCAPPPGMTHC